MGSSFGENTDTPSLIQPFENSSICLILINMGQNLVFQSILALALRPDPTGSLDVRTPIFTRYDKFGFELDFGIGNDFFDGSGGVTGGFG
jgi:hypothetical protein